jgi:hypothetical protein
MAEAISAPITFAGNNKPSLHTTSAKQSLNLSLLLLPPLMPPKEFF